MMSNLREMLNTWDNADSELNKKIDNTKAEVDKMLDDKVDRKEFENKQWKHNDMIANVSATSTITDIDFSRYSEILVMAIANSTTLYTSIFPAFMVYSGYNCRVATEDSSKYVNVKFSDGSTVITLPSNINSVRILAR